MLVGRRAVEGVCGSRLRGVVWMGRCKESGLDEDKLMIMIDASGGFKS
jgi:hypothetical protein